MALKPNEPNGSGEAFKPEFEDISNSADEMTGSNFDASPLLPSKTGDRIKRKYKRPRLHSTGETGLANGQGNGTVGMSLRNSKNSRRPRTRYGRGLPKKGGAGGKGTWGKPGSELAVEGVDINRDIRDPNYDSESQESCEFEAIVPEMTDEEVERNVDPILMEYFEHGDTEEVALSLEELNIETKKPLLVVLAITLAMERKPSHREMTSVLLSDLYGHILSEEDIECGFDSLIKNLPDLILDTPDADVVLGNFIARAVADDCLPPKFVQEYKEKFECSLAKTCLDHASTLLSMKHGLVRLDNVWGVGGGMRPVKYLVKKIQLLLKEYLCSGDVEEATRCLQELEVPHFHHELVYESVVMVIEDMGERAMDLVCKLLKSLTDSAIVTVDQLKNGFERVYAEMPDICIDVPPAYSLLKQFVVKCESYGFMPEELARHMPSRGRKRYVSEGDGGLVKESV